MGNGAAGWEQRRGPPWLLWFAWHPVQMHYVPPGLAGAYGGQVVRGEWVWLKNVARQVNPLDDEFGLTPRFYYAPAHVALTQKVA